MDLTDILFSKPFIGSGGGGESSNVETATIVITVTDSTPAITSGEFPDWCTVANSNNIYGKAELDGCYYIYEGEEYEYENGPYGIQAVMQEENYTMITSYGGEDGAAVRVALDLSFAGYGPNAQFSRGTITINLIYMPEE